MKASQRACELVFAMKRWKKAFTLQSILTPFAHFVLKKFFVTVNIVATATKKTIGNLNLQ
jgi:hypothetical protein